MESLGDQSGVSRPTISRALNGHTNPQSATVKRLADALGVPTSALWDEKEPTSESSHRSEQSGILPPRLDEFLAEEGYEIADRVKDEMRAVRVVFKRPPAPDVDWFAFWRKLVDAFLAVERIRNGQSPA